MMLGAFCSGYGIWMYVTWLPGYLEAIGAGIYYFMVGAPITDADLLA
jgi:hypothetical protein